MYETPPVSMAPPNTKTNSTMRAIGVTAVVMIVSGLRRMWRSERPVRTVVSPKKWVVLMTVPHFP